MPNKPEITAIPTEGKAAHLGAIGYLAVLAYPNRSEWRMRDQFVEACKALLLGIAIKRGLPPSEVYPRFRKLRDREIHSRVQHGSDRIYDRRLVAAVLAGRMMLDLKRPMRISRLVQSLVGMPPSSVKMDLKSQVDNRLHRLWAESLPVLHLALVVARRLQENSDNLMRLVYQPAWVSPAIENAELLRKELHRFLPRFTARNAIRLIRQA